MSTTAPPSSPKSTTNFRGIFLAAAVGFFFQKLFKSNLYPWGIAVPTGERVSYANVDQSNDLLTLKHGRTQKIFERVPEGVEPLLHGPETVFFGHDGTMYTVSEESKLLSFSDFEDLGNGIVTARVQVVRDLGAGRPLGAKFTPDGNTLYLGDSILGLTRIQNFHDPTSKVEIVASEILDEGRRSRLLFANDIAIGPETGKVYFTDSTTVAPPRIETRTWATFIASKIDAVRGAKTGRLLEYDPSSDEVKVLARGLWFANGVAVDNDESYILFAETFGMKLLKRYLKGEKKGLTEPVVESQSLTGYLDGVDCSWRTGKCYTVLPTVVIPLQKLLLLLPVSVETVLRTLILALPTSLYPNEAPYGCILEIDRDHSVKYIQDPTGRDVAMLTGVTEHEGKLYLGSLKNNYITVYTP